MSKLIGKEKLSIGLLEYTKQNGSEEVDDDKDVRVSVVRGRKITITTISVILVGGKLLMKSTKMTLLEDRQYIRVKKIWIKTIS